MLMLIMVAMPHAMFAYDKYFAPRPFVSATLTLEDRGAEGVFVAYDADATQPVDGIWIATIHSETGERLSSRRGDGKYSAKVDDPRTWSWAAFFDAEDGVPAPDVPSGEFHLCVRYIATARDSGFTHDTPEFCSNMIQVAS